MEWNEEEIDAARQALQTVNDAVDAITNGATKLEALLIALMHSVRSPDLPADHLESALWLASDVAADIRLAAQRLR